MQERKWLLLGAIPALLLLWGFLVPVCAEGTAEAQWQKADKGFRAGRYAEAKQIYEQFIVERGEINKTPGQRVLNAHILLQLGRCCRNLHEFGKGRDVLGRIIGKYSDDTEACSAAQYEIGLSYAKEGLKSLASAALEKVVTNYPQERGIGAYALLKKAKIDCHPSRYGEAVKTLKRLIADYSDKKGICAEAKWILAETLDNSYRADEALQVLDGIGQDKASSDDDKGEALVQAANVQLHALRFGDAKQTCGKLLEQCAGRKWYEARAKYAMIQVLCEDGSDPDTALGLIDEMRKLPWHIGDRSRLAQLALWEGGAYWIKVDYKKADECFTRLIADYGDVSDIVGQAYFHRVRLRTYGLKAYDDAASDIARIPVAYLRHYAQGDLDFAQGQYEKAASEFENVMTTLPQHRVSSTEPLRALRRLRLSYEKLGRKAEAASALGRLTKLKSDRNLPNEEVE